MYGIISMLINLITLEPGVYMSLGLNVIHSAVGFIKNALFKSYGNACWSSQHSWCLDELLLYKTNSFVNHTSVQI